MSEEVVVEEEEEEEELVEFVDVDWYVWCWK